jgi:hypothetical protein
MGSPGIFISYRRGDTAGYAGRLFDRLVDRFGSGRVFMDVEDLRPGEDFAQTIQDRIAHCAVVVVMIGPQWLTLLRSRSTDENDYVCLETEAALKAGSVIIPALVGGALMPREADLPGSLRELSRREALDIRDVSFDADICKLGDAAEAVSSLGTLEQPHELTGAWTARMQRRGRPPWRIRLDLEAVDDKLYGSVDYPTGVRSIYDGKIEGHRFSFRTSHIPQFSSEPAIIRFEGELVGGTLRLLTADDDGVAKGDATRDKEP